MRILIDSGSYSCGNVGDLAMLQTAIERLSDLWPRASIAVLTSAPADLRVHCPGVRPVPVIGRTAFASDRFFGRADRLLPQGLSRSIASAERYLRQRCPAVLAYAIASKGALARRPEWAAPRVYVDALRRADLVLVSGAGMFTDAFVHNALGVMATLELAAEWKIPTALMGQGFGPVTDPSLRQRMAAVLPRVNLIGLREGCESTRLLKSIGVAADRIVVTGDDAIEMANRRTPPKIGCAIGVNIRAAAYAGVDKGTIDRLRPALYAAASRCGGHLVPVPIAYHRDRSDVDSIHRLIGGPPNGAVSASSSERPLNVISVVSHCRTVITGSYHAAVFALAQGIPVVALVASSYYRHKFSGLADLFGGGCQVLDIEAPDAPAALEQEVARSWAEAPNCRDPLLRQAGKQIERGKAAYRRLGKIVDAGTGTSRTTTALSPCT